MHPTADSHSSVVTISAVAMLIATLPDPYRSALSDADPAVRHHALLAAAWTRQYWLLDFCRKLSQRPTADYWTAPWLLAILGTPADLDLLLSISRTVPLGPKRYELLGLFGHPAVVDTLLRRIDSQDPLTAPVAGKAFTKITGIEIASDKTATIPPANTLLPDQEPSEPTEVQLPDPALAADHWARVRGLFSHGTRWCRGLDLSQPITPDVLEKLDLESRWETRLRGQFHDSWHGAPMDLEAYPQSGGRSA